MSITAGVIDLAPVPPVASMRQSLTSPHALSNPYTGFGTLSPVSGGVQAFGLHFQVNAAPAGAGHSFRAIVEYELPWLSIAEAITLADASNVIGNHHLLKAAQGFVLFSTAYLTLVSFDVLAGWSVDFHWLIS